MDHCHQMGPEIQCLPQYQFRPGSQLDQGSHCFHDPQLHLVAHLSHHYPVYLEFPDFQ